MEELKKEEPAKSGHFAAPPGGCFLLELTATVIQTHNVSASWLPLEPYAAILGAGLVEGPERVLTPCRARDPSSS